MANKKILVATTSFPRWDEDIAGNFVYQLSKKLSDSGFSMIILAPHFSGAKKFENKDGLEVYRFQYFWPVPWQKLCYGGGILPNIKKNKFLIFQVPFLFIAEFFAARKIIKKLKIDLVHAHWIIPSGLVAFLIKELYGVPFIFTSHGSDVMGVRNRFLNPAKKLVFKNAKRITVVSSALKKEIVNWAGNAARIDIIPMGVDVQLFNREKRDASLKKKYDIEGYFLLFVGRLSPEKGVSYLMEAMAEVIKKFPTAKLMLIGEGTLENELKNLARKLCLQDNVIFLGAIHHAQLGRFYATADIFICPSLREGAGLVFMEAILSGCAAIGTRVGGITDFIKDGENGLLVAPKDEKMLAEKIIYLLENSAIRQGLTAKANDYTKRFGWENIAKQYQGVLLEAIEQK